MMFGFGSRNVSATKERYRHPGFPEVPLRRRRTSAGRLRAFLRQICAEEQLLGVEIALSLVVQTFRLPENRQVLHLLGQLLEPRQELVPVVRPDHGPGVEQLPKPLRRPDLPLPGQLQAAQPGQEVRGGSGDRDPKKASWIFRKRRPDGERHPDAGQEEEVELPVLENRREDVGGRDCGIEKKKAFSADG